MKDFGVQVQSDHLERMAITSLVQTIEELILNGYDVNAHDGRKPDLRRKSKLVDISYLKQTFGLNVAKLWGSRVWTMAVGLKMQFS